jgi:hypothetical protein
MKKLTGMLALVCVWAWASGAWAAVIFNVNMTGAQEVPGPGDPDGVAAGTLTLDPVVGGGTISWSFNYSNIDGTALTGMHIHGPLPDPPALQTANVFVGLGVGSSVPPAGTLSGSLTGQLANINTILANPTRYYVNLHSTSFPAGAVRADLPEPTALGLFGLAAWGMLRRRRASGMLGR